MNPDFSLKKDDLSPELRRVALEKGTEMPFTGQYWDTHEDGAYRCAICDAELFSSETKFDSGTGWPSFTEPANTLNVEFKQDSQYGIPCTEVLCKNCGAHLGHVFNDGPAEAGGQRYCINSVCLRLDKKSS
ncbi:peptide-methionine (R)-S-oxide reductase MsrB [Patescibacteria group bacterium]|nr:peptide-methionine (R)-S-oxide reductase MsrB [Patescibacteria group bacterium]